MDLARSLRDVVDHFGAAAGYDYDDYDDYETDHDSEPRAAADEPDRRYEERLRARRLEGAGGADFDDIYDEAPAARRRSAPEPGARPLALVRPQHVEFALVAPRSFEETQPIADRFRAGEPVIVDLQGCEAELAERLIDFCSGLTYALDGGLEVVDQAILVLTPTRVELSGEPALGLRAKGFFNRM